MSCQAKASWPACTNSGGTARRAAKACRSAARSSSSPQSGDTSVRCSSSPPLFLMALTSCLVSSCLPVFAAAQEADVRRAPQQFAAAWRKLGERGTERCITFRPENLVVDVDGIGIHGHLILGREPRVRMPVRYPQHAKAFILRGFCQPSG